MKVSGNSVKNFLDIHSPLSVFENMQYTETVNKHALTYLEGMYFTHLTVVAFLQIFLMKKSSFHIKKKSYIPLAYRFASRQMKLFILREVITFHYTLIC